MKIYITLFFVFSLVGLSKARAYEDSATVGLNIGTQLHGLQNTYSASPISLGLSSSFGMSEAWTFRNFTNYSYFLNHQSAHHLNLGAEMVYMIDILQWVPFLGGGTNLLVQFDSKKDTTASLGFHGTVGVDWLIIPNWILGLDLRGGFYPAGYRQSGFPFFSAMIRFSRKFDLE